MKKVIAFAVVAVLVAGSSAIAQINLQGQNWNLGLTNVITLSGTSPIDAGTIQGVGTLSIQSMGINPDKNGNPLVSAQQGIGAALFQTGKGHTDGALLTIDQGLTITGNTLNGNGPGQVQSVGNNGGAAMEFQGVDMDAHNTLDKKSGTNANADALNIVAFGMGQAVSNNCADGSQLSLTLGGQASYLNGTAQSIGHVATAMYADVVQIQSANAPVPVQP
jgi:hypothetical protein